MGRSSVLTLSRRSAVGHTVYLAPDSRALIEQSWAWLELGVRVFCLRVSVLSVHAAGEAADPCRQTFHAFLYYPDPTDALHRLKQVLCGELFLCRLV